MYVVVRIAGIAGMTGMSGMTRMTKRIALDEAWHGNIQDLVSIIWSRDCLRNVMGRIWGYVCRNIIIQS